MRWGRKERRLGGNVMRNGVSKGEVGGRRMQVEGGEGQEKEKESIDK